MAVRFLDLYSPEIESTYASLPLEFINQKISQDQGKFDNALAQASAISADPLGLKNIVDERQKNIDMPDYQRALAWTNKFNEKVSNTVQDLYSSGDFSRVTPVIANLNREYKQQQSPEGILGINKARQEAYVKLQEGLSKVKGLENSKWLSLPYLREIEKMKNPNYIPTANVGYADPVDRLERVNKAMSGINDELWSMYANTDGNYIRTGKKYGIDADKIKNTFYNGFKSDTQLQSDIDAQIEYEYLRNYDNAQEKDYNDFYTERKVEIYDGLLKNAMKYKKSMGDMGMSSDGHGVAKTTFGLENPENIFSKTTEGSTVTSSTVGDWKRILTTTKEQYNAAVQNAQSIGQTALINLGVTDPKIQMYINANRDKLRNPDGSLNIDAFEEITKIKVTNENYSTIKDNFEVYNEAQANENNLLRRKNNIESRVEVVQDKIQKDLGINDDKLLEEFNRNKEYLSLNGITDFSVFKEKFIDGDLPTAPIPGNKKSTGQWSDRDDIQFVQPNYGIYNNYEQKINDEKISFDANYHTLSSTNDKVGIGAINSHLTEQIKSSPTVLLNATEDKSGQPLRSLLSKEDLKTINDGNFSVEVISNPMAVSGKRGVMLSFKRKDGSDVQYPISSTSYDMGTFDKLVNDSYFNLKDKKSSSDMYETEEFKELSTLKGNLHAGEQLYKAQMYNKPYGATEHIVTENGTNYGIRRENRSGVDVFKMTIITPEGEYEINEQFNNEDAILQRIGEDAFRLDLRNNVSKDDYESYDEKN